MNKIGSLPSLDKFEKLINQTKNISPLKAYNTLQSVEIFEKYLIDYPKPIVLTEDDSPDVIDEYYRIYREILDHAHALYGLTIKVETYYNSKEDPKIKQESIQRLEKIFTILWADITFISQLKDRILIKKEIGLANKTLLISILAMIIAIVSIFITAILQFLTP